MFFSLPLRFQLGRLLRSASENFSEGTGEETPTDHQLVAQFQQGKEAAFTQLVLRHRNRVFGLIVGMIQTEADAWDLTQEVFVKVWKALPRLEPQAKFTTWLYRVAHNAVYDWLRKRKVRPEHELEETHIRPTNIAAGAQAVPKETTRPDEAAEKSDLKNTLQAALNTLSEAHRNVIILKDIQGLKYREIAEITGCSQGTVMSRIHHARQQLRSILTQNDPSFSPSSTNS